MAIVKNKLRRLRFYPFRAITGRAAELMQAAVDRLGDVGGDYPATALSLFECFCDLAGIQVTEKVLTSPSVQNLYDRFCGAMASEKFCMLRLKRRHSLCVLLAKVFQELKTDLPRIPIITWNPKNFDRYVDWWDVQDSLIPIDKRLYWTGWPVENRAGSTKDMHLADLWNSHGQEFVEEIHREVRIHMEGRAGFVHENFKKMFKFLHSNQSSWPTEIFKDPIKIYDFFAAFMQHIFTNRKPTDPTLPNLMIKWDKHINQIYSMFIHSRVWATPFRELPIIGAERPSGNSTHVVVTPDGKEVRNKLLTPIPLHITQTEAIKLLILQIKEDLRIVREWATAQSLKTIKAFNRRKELASSATSAHRHTYAFWENNTLSNLAAHFEKVTYDIDWSAAVKDYKKYCDKNIGSADLGEKLGIPTTHDLYPFQCLLIIEHPCITNSFLTRFELFDKNGKQTGFFDEGGKSYLAVHDDAKFISGIKGRKGERLGRQKFEISSTAAAVISDVITITNQARHHLKSRNDENWRKLFIASPTGATLPRGATIPRWNKPTFERPGRKRLVTRTIGQFSPFTAKRENELKQLIWRVCPDAIRASKGVEVYIDTGSTNTMRESLGHHIEDSKLLTSYLPEAFVRFIEGRGVKIVQKALICHSLRNSPFLVQGANFESMELLDQFLKNYVLKDIPAFLTDPEGLNETRLSSEINELLVLIGEGSLSALLSLKVAVDLEKDQRLVSEAALEWAMLTRLIEKEIENSIDPLLKKHLATARKNVNPARMVNLIYGKPK
ncbi:hypothetical protein [Pseudomonas sp. TWP3-2]|uniref:hypothetical protein n=1 Tax=Pseudomonas sp. TWP3-2 TaxID=2804574 RepID=UPI003CF2B95A